MNIIIEIERYDPLTDKVPHISSSTVTADPTDRVLDLLIDIARNQDGTLAFRRSCAPPTVPATMPGLPQRRS